VNKVDVAITSKRSNSPSIVSTIDIQALQRNRIRTHNVKSIKPLTLCKLMFMSVRLKSYLSIAATPLKLADKMDIAEYAKQIIPPLWIVQCYYGA
jgi:hypothetical protein